MKINVLLKSPWKFVDSPYYKNLVSYPPENVNFLINWSKVNTIVSPKLFVIRNTIKGVLRKTLEITKIPNLVFTSSGVDLIHCAHCLLLNKRSWVVDMEHYWNFSASSKISYSSLGKSLIRRFLRREYCKKILPWTHAAKNTLKEAIKDEEILRKTEVVYPAISLFKLKKKKHDKISLLFIGRYFYQKGGLITLEVFRRLKKRYDIDCTLISLTIPNELKVKYQKFIRIFTSVSDEFLFEEIYPSSDIFIYPGFSDTFGFSLLEAMSFEIPIVTVDAFARREIVEDEKNGFVIERPHNVNVYRIGNKEEKIINEMVKKASSLIESSSLRRKMGRYGRMLVEKGKFSIRERNKKLRRIYEEAIRR